MSNEEMESQEPSLFEDVEVSATPKRRRRRGPGKAHVARTGLTGLTAESTDDLTSLAPEGAAEFLIKLRADRVNGRVAVYAVPWGTPGGAMFRRDRGGYIIFHMGDVFDQFPKLRPEYDIETPAVLDKDEKGRPFLSINIKGGIVHTTQKQAQAPAQAQAQDEESDADE
ncbi:MAG TPA: hypothetical protein VK464_17705 [Symbiobacteriaceae bacterium]|jgi:hypothetical protein|nr:hypothetical protein [Symbiobacteriaceae bacterium]